MSRRRRIEPGAATAMASQMRCPDCAAELHLAERAPGVYVLNVAHDPTCPTYRQLRSQGRAT